jgi:hypothetical protein
VPRTAGTWLRYAIYAAALMLIGAAASIVFAWAMVIRNPPLSQVQPITVLGDAQGARFLAQHSSGLARDSWRVFRGEDAPSDLDTAPAWVALPEGDQYFANTFAWGWPCTCLANWDVDSTTSSTPNRLHAFTFQRGINFYELPAQPLWGGLFLNSLAFLFTSVLLVQATLRSTRWIRSKRRRVGSCPRCGYDRAGLAVGSPCPECGSLASARPPPATPAAGPHSGSPPSA